MADKQWSRRSLINTYTASGATTPLETSVLDMLNFENVLFIGMTSTTSTGNRLHFLQGTATASGGLAQTIGETSMITSGAFLDVYRPTARFVQGQLTATAGSGNARGLVAIRYGARIQPTSHEAGTTGKQLYSPVTGTATSTA